VPSLVRDTRGFTLIEVSVASLVLLVGTLGVIAMVDFANRTTAQAKGREAATSLGRQIVEDVRAIPFDQLDPNSLADDLQSQPGLEATPGSTAYTLRRRGLTYTINATVCSLDDPRDGIGSHTGGNFCTTGSNWKGCALLGTVAQTGSANYQAILGSLYTSAQSAATGTSCTTGTATAADLDPQDYKRVDVTVSWGNRSARQSTLIANPGASAGPAVTNLVVTNNGGAITVTDSTLNTLNFGVTTNRTPAAVNWLLDGDAQGTASGSGTSWAFGWDLGAVNTPKVYDGAYIVGARAVDANGVAGASRTLTVTINRRKAFAPTGVAAGRNNQVVEIEWDPNPERDVTGYRVYRGTGSSATLVCPSSGTAPIGATTCQDLSPPSTSPLQYFVVAVDRDNANALREGDQSTLATVVQGNNPPNPPTGLVASTNAGNTVLRWTAPNPADPDAGDSIHFYRIYRDGQSYADRYDRTGDGATLTYTDTSTGGFAHTYWITAVDGQLAESTIVGPVTK
jgi:prepilin-type N-terminal cleavage/methylation domain-containing protein